MNTQTPATGLDSRTGQKAWVRAVASTLSALLVASVLTIAPSLPAAAADRGSGIWVGGNGDYWLGSFITVPGGVRTYCIEPGMNPPVGFTQSAGVERSSVTIRFAAYYGSGVLIEQGTRTLNATTVGRINYLIRTYGQTTNNNQGAAVQWAIKRFTNPHHNTEVSTGRWPSVPAGVRNQGDAYYSEALNYTPSTGSGTGTFTFAVDGNNNYLGHLNITALSPSPTTGTITLTNGVFASNGLDTITGTFSAGDSLAIEGVPPEGESAYKISAHGLFNGPSATLTTYATPSGNRQMLAGPGPLGSFDVFAEDPFDRATVFAPVVTTQVANKYVTAGDAFTDVLTFNTADLELEGENPGDPPVTIHNPWYQFINGNYARVTAHGTLYGPFTSEPVESATPPLGAPVAATATVTTTQVGGPTITYPATTTATASTAGYYTWVWEIDYPDQPLLTQAYLVDDYLFIDRFGQVAETHILPAGIEAVSQVSVAEIPLSGTITDTLTVSVVPGSAWLADSSGAPIPITFRGDAWLWPGPDAPVVSATVPAGASLLETVTITTSTPGAFVSPPITAPSTGDGWVSWVWSIRTADQPAALQGLVSEWADEFGLPAETTQLLTPTVSTLAVDEVALGEAAHDVATVGGTLPAINPSLTFAAYLQPVGGPATCVTPAYDSIAAPIEVTELGEYRSPDVVFTEAGTYFWVETLWSHDGQIIHKGDCGATDETTLAHQVIVTTVAVEQIVLGEEAFDTAYVRGTPPAGSYLEFAAYRQVDDVPTCDGSTLAFTSTPVMLAGAGEYQSPPALFSQPGTYFWVEYLYDDTDTLLHAGECGAVTEITTVTPPLVVTGFDSASGALLAGVAAMLTLIGLGGLIFVRRRRAATA